MNFTTDLPKKNPIVSYIVASAVKCEKFFPESAKEGPVFRMHAVILTRKSLLNYNSTDPLKTPSSQPSLATTSTQNSGGSVGATTVSSNNDFGVSAAVAQNLP